MDNIVLYPGFQSLREAGILLKMNVKRERRQLVFHIKTAQTQERVEALKEIVENWLNEWPKDVVIQRATRELANKKAWLKKIGEWH
jgi:hypothetical protein